MAHRHKHEAPGVVDPASLGEPDSRRETAKDSLRPPIGHRHKHEAPGVVDAASLGEGSSTSEKDRPQPPIGHRHKHEAPGVVDSASLGETSSTRDKEQTMQRKDKVEGEGSYSGSKDYNERTRKFVDSGKVADAARKAQPKSDQEKHAMQKAERIGKAKSKGEDPALRDPTKIPDDPNFPRKK